MPTASQSPVALGPSVPVSPDSLAEIQIETDGPLVGLRLTWRQLQTLRALTDLTARDGYPPSGKDLADAIAISPQGMGDKITALKTKGFIRSAWGVHRSMRVTELGAAALACCKAVAPHTVAYFVQAPPDDAVSAEA